VARRFLAASLACGPDAVVSHRWAGILHGFLPLSSSQAVDVSVPGRHRAQQGLILHHPRALASIDTTVKDAVPVTAPMRTLADLAALLGAVALERAVRQAERHRLLDVRALDAHLGAGRAGTARLRGVISRFDEGLITRSELEQRFYALTRAARLVRPLANVPVDRFVVDFLWPEQRLVVEIDGWQDHGTRSAFERDRERDVVLAQCGLRVVRFTWRQVVHEPAAVADGLARILRGPSPPPATPASAAAR
jgi:very-short-patch-repair endonuclease